jgi:three-Cys-motif partner protein
MAHQFGGLWTQQKLQVLEEYLRFYATALKNQGFTLHYADAFAGTGRHQPMQVDGQELLIPAEDFRGSVITGLSVEPGFHRYHFNDLAHEHVKELEQIRAEYPARDIRITNLDANEFVSGFCAGLGRLDRAVLLLDPYSTQLDWATLEHVKRSGKVDLWLLFPLSAVLRMTPTDGVMPEWKHTLDRLLGSNDWEQALYKPVEAAPMNDLFDTPATIEPATHRLNTRELQQWVTGRLKELFPFVAEPYLLKSRRSPLFLFYFAVSNTNPRAQDLARRAANYIIRKQTGSK